MLKLAIRLARHDHGILNDIEEIIGKHRIYLQGTDTPFYVDYYRREDANLAMVNLNQIIGVHAHIVNDHAN